MEIFEMIITAEEARNYRHFYYELKTLRFIDWVKTYIFTVSILIIIAFLTSDDITGDYFCFVVQNLFNRQIYNIYGTFDFCRNTEIKVYSNECHDSKIL